MTIIKFPREYVTVECGRYLDDPYTEVFFIVCHMADGTKDIADHELSHSKALAEAQVVAREWGAPEKPWPVVDKAGRRQ